MGAPGLTGLLHLIDPERKAAPFAATSQLIGISIIPTVAGETLAASSLTLVLIACLGSIILSGILVASQIPWLLRRPRLPF